jgi:hypothetical protein
MVGVQGVSGLQDYSYRTAKIVTASLLLFEPHNFYGVILSALASL